MSVGREAAGAAGDVGRIEAALEAARSTGTGRAGGPDFLAALALLRQVREQLAAWEPELIDAARAGGASWAQLAPALGVASRQAAERRALRRRPVPGQQAPATGEARVAAERGRRAGVRAVDAWSAAHAADLRVLAAQVGAAVEVSRAASGPAAALRAALGAPDAAALLAPLVEAGAHLGPEHRELARRVEALRADVAVVRADAAARRRG